MIPIQRERRVEVAPTAEMLAGPMMQVFGVSGHALQGELRIAQQQFTEMAQGLQSSLITDVQGVMGQVGGMMDRFMERSRLQAEGEGRRVMHPVVEGMDGDILVLYGEDTLADLDIVQKPLSTVEFLYAAGSALEEQAWQEFAGGVVMGLQFPPLTSVPPILEGRELIIPGFAVHLKTLAQSMKAFAGEGIIPSIIPFQGQYEIIDFQREARAIAEREAHVA